MDHHQWSSYISLCQWEHTLLGPHTGPITAKVTFAPMRFPWKSKNGQWQKLSAGQLFLSTSLMVDASTGLLLHDTKTFHFVPTTTWPSICLFHHKGSFILFKPQMLLKNWIFVHMKMNLDPYIILTEMNSQQIIILNVKINQQYFEKKT